LADVKTVISEAGQLEFEFNLFWAI